MKVIYIIGPFRAENTWEVEQNIRIAEGMALAVWRLGAVPICMHSMNRFFMGTMLEEIFLRGDLEILNRCADAAITVGLWMGSSGSRAEHNKCRELNLPIFGNLSDLKIWLYDVGMQHD
ncbi:hypothetical protein LCGC14_0478250 [marine sediment metagenome]|uniref:DUF7768 domain-containing protein n=1 Tax=marine sediment metagenome TaxID=412755 RepID=A0A0F9SA77_9ZZZZ